MHSHVQGTFVLTDIYTVKALHFVLEKAQRIVCRPTGISIHKLIIRRHDVDSEHHYWCCVVKPCHTRRRRRTGLGNYHVKDWSTWTTMSSALYGTDRRDSVGGRTRRLDRWTSVTWRRDDVMWRTMWRVPHATPTSNGSYALLFYTSKLHYSLWDITPVIVMSRDMKRDTKAKKERTAW